MRNIVLAGLIVFGAGRVRAQTAEGGGTPAAKTMQETGRVLRQAQSSAAAEAARQSAERAADNGLLGQMAREAKVKLAQGRGDETRQLVDAVDQRLAPALREAAPEGRAIIAQSAAAPALRAPDREVPAAGGSGKKAAGGPTKKAAAPPPSEINIRSEDAVYLDANQALAIFTEDVVLDHPQFHMTSDKLEVYFIKETPKKEEPEKKDGGNPPAGPGVPPVAQPAEGPAAPSEDAKLKQAIATGRKVVIQKLDENGDPQIGICRHLTYEGATGDIILREMPQVQRGSNVIIARDSSTYMVLKQNGELKVHGPANTRMEQKSIGGGKPAAPTPAPPGPPGGVTGASTVTPKRSAKK